jgi:hypothetical protein
MVLQVCISSADRWALGYPFQLAPKAIESVVNWSRFSVDAGFIVKTVTLAKFMLVWRLLMLCRASMVGRYVLDAGDQDQGWF